MPRWPKKPQGDDLLPSIEPPKKGRVTEVRYERVFPIPNRRFETERISLTSTVEPDEPVNLVIERLKRIAMRNSVSGNGDLEKARAIAKNPDDYRFGEVSWARAYLETMGEA